uniref:Uncharacterized protein n=1 Tax=Glossina brevipalpis TaxID=37001 RepID=A0A1A9W6S0_9MUSC
MVSGIKRHRLSATRLFFAIVVLGSLAVFCGYRMPSHEKEVIRLRSEIFTLENMRARLYDMLNKKAAKNYEQIIKENLEEKRKLKRTIEELEAEVDRLKKKSHGTDYVNAIDIIFVTSISTQQTYQIHQIY